MRISDWSSDVCSSDLSAERRLRAEHFMASGALPPGFPAVEIDGEYYWDGGLVSNPPLSRVLNSEPRRDTLTFQVDLWSAKGPPPSALREAIGRSWCGERG